MFRRPPSSTRTDTLFPYTTLFRSDARSGTDVGNPSGRDLDLRFPVRRETRQVPAVAHGQEAQAEAQHDARPGHPFHRQLHPRAAHLHHGCGECGGRSEEHTSELQSLMRISYAVFCLKKKTKKKQTKEN